MQQWINRSANWMGRAVAMAAVATAALAVLAPGAQAQDFITVPGGHLSAHLPTTHPTLPTTRPSDQPGGFEQTHGRSADFYHYWDSRYQWCILRVEYTHFNPSTHAYLVKVTLFQYDHRWRRWYTGIGSGSELNGHLAFALRRPNDWNGTLYFEGQAHAWGSIHRIGYPHQNGWFWLQPYH